MRCFITNRICDYDAPQKSEGQPPEDVFMISPFGFPFDDIFESSIKPTLDKLHLSVCRADKALELGYVMCRRICLKIRSARFVLCDISRPNGNVYYELGLSLGFGKPVVLLVSARSSHMYLNSFRRATECILEYNSTKSLANSKVLQSKIEQPFCLTEEQRKDLDPESRNLLLSSPPEILNLASSECPIAEIQQTSIANAIQRYGQEDVKVPIQNLPHYSREPLEDWQITTHLVNQDFNINETLSLITRARICVVDMTHYSDEANAYMFFMLGLAHAIQRDVIPVINRPLNRSMPFDVHGLWQVSYSSVSEMEDEFSQILPNIDTDFKKQKDEYLSRQVWNDFITAGYVHVVTCARRAEHDEDRGNRTNVDKWDFQTVSDLSYFIAQKYPSSRVITDPPRNKEETRQLKKANERQKLLADLEKDLSGKDCIVIGSPDVSDYAEVALAKIHNLNPYEDSDESKLPFVFVKKTKALDHPRQISAFYRIPKDDEPEKVILKCMNDATVDCTDRECDHKGERIKEGQTSAVITLAPNPWTDTSVTIAPRIMIISGFTGVATLGATQFLCSPQYQEQLKEYLDRRDDLQPFTTRTNNIINILLEIHYTEPLVEYPPGDMRKFQFVRFSEVGIINHKQCDTARDKAR